MKGYYFVQLSLHIIIIFTFLDHVDLICIQCLPCMYVPSYCLKRTRIVYAKKNAKSNHSWMRVKTHNSFFMLSVILLSPKHTFLNAFRSFRQRLFLVTGKSSKAEKKLLRIYVIWYMRLLAYDCAKSVPFLCRFNCFL